MSDFIGLVLAFTALILWTCVFPTLGLLWLFGWIT
jgi:hypothetical protein